jgi:hypothetical protein
MGIFSREQKEININCQKLLDFFDLIGLDVNALPAYGNKEYICWIENFKVKPLPAKDYTDFDFYVELNYITHIRGYANSNTRLPSADVYKLKFLNGKLDIKEKGTRKIKMVGEEEYVPRM